MTKLEPSAKSTVVRVVPLQGDTPEKAAEGYMALLMARDFNGAAAWVLPSQQGILQALALSSTGAPRPEITGRLRVGSVQPTGQDSVMVTLIGKVCQDGPAGGHCISNDNQSSKDPNFILRLVETHETGWKIVFQDPNTEK